MAQTLRLTLLFSIFVLTSASAQEESVARKWNEALLQTIRQDFARPPVQARNLFHTSLAMYDAWAAYDSVAQPYLLGKTVSGYTCPFEGVPVPANIEAAREQAISFAMFRILLQRFSLSPNFFQAYVRFTTLMNQLGYDFDITSTNYQSGSPAALGNYIAACVLQMGLQDGANEQGNYAIQYYQTVNTPLVMADPGNPNILDPNRWQRLTLEGAIDQSGNPVPATQSFQSPEWGNVTPFAMTAEDVTVYERDNNEYLVYHDPGPFPTIDTLNGGAMSDEYKWNFALVTAWGAHHDPNDGVLWDISPRSIGNVQTYPQTVADYHDFYNFENGGDTGVGREINPKTGLPYEPQIVPRGDYTRVLAQYWADGPTSETPPGHWYTILNYAADHPDFVKKYNGKGPILDDLEWDVKAYFTLGGAVHDAAVSAWGIKGWYDGVRPVSALRYMADRGQSSDPGLPSYHIAGVPLIPGFIELVGEGDPLAGANNEHVGKIKFYSWRGPDYITNPLTDIGGVGWILAEEWWPYQRKTFVTPPFGGYISGHSTYSRAAAEVLTLLSGDEYFPGGMGEFHIAANSNFLGLEKGPSVDVTLQWATYRDASDQTSLSRIWGGIHPPMDDIPGRVIGAQAGTGAFHLAKTYFYTDTDQDGFFSFEDCNDQAAAVNPEAAEVCDGLDNDCNGETDELPFFTYYADADGDGFGDAATALDTCLSEVAGYVSNSSDCDDSAATLNPAAVEVCDGLDNDCNGETDELPFFTYYADADGDGFGDAATALDTCLSEVPGYVSNNSDCDDQAAALNPTAVEVCDGLDNDCNGETDELPFFTYYADADGDGFGDAATALDTCLNEVPGYVSNNSDCDDSAAALNPAAVEVCDGLDNDCNGETDELSFFTYYADADGDGFGDAATVLDTCLSELSGYVSNNSDCDDENLEVNPEGIEVLDGLDNDCNGLVDDVVATTDLFRNTKLFPNPVSDVLMIHHTGQAVLGIRIFNSSGQLLRNEALYFDDQSARVDFSAFATGLYFVNLYEGESGKELVTKVIKVD